MNLTVIGLIGIFLLLVFIFARMPVGFAMALVGGIGFAMITSPASALSLLARDFFDVFGSYNLTVIPLFILMGQIAYHSGISGNLFAAANKFMGRLPGGLAVAAIGACAAFSAVCGSTNATAATMGSVVIPEMKKHRYNPSFSMGLVAAASSLGVLIPPSVIFIVYGVMTEQSINKLFVAGIIPGILLTFLLIATAMICIVKHPDLAPRGTPFTWKERIRSLSGVLETLALFVLIMGGLFCGLFTPTEAAGVGAFGALVISVCRRRLSFNMLVQSLLETTRISCMIMMIVAGATVFSHFLAVTQIPFEIANMISALNLPAPAVLLLIILGFLIGGCFIDSLALIMLMVPIFYPVVLALGYDPIWFGVVSVMVLQIGVITPPVGINVYVVAGIDREVPLASIFKSSFPFLIAILIGTLLLIPFPQIALFLPNLM